MQPNSGKPAAAKASAFVALVGGWGSVFRPSPALSEAKDNQTNIPAGSSKSSWSLTVRSGPVDVPNVRAPCPAQHWAGNVPDVTDVMPQPCQHVHYVLKKEALAQTTPNAGVPGPQKGP